MRLNLFFFIFIFSFSSVLLCHEASFDTEPAKLNTDDAGAVKPGDFELEFAYALSTGHHSYDHEADRNKRGRFREHAFDWSLAAGLTDRIELNATIAYSDLLDKETEDVDPVTGEGLSTSPNHGNGWNDVEVGSKIEIFRSQARDFILTYAPSVVIPSGREGRDDRLAPGGDSTVFNQRAIVTKSWNRISTDLDFGYGILAGNRKGNRGTADVNFALGYQVFRWLQPEMEFHYAHDFMKAENDSDLFAMTWGVVMPLHERIRIATGVQQGLAGKNADQATTFSIVTTLFL